MWKFLIWRKPFYSPPFFIIGWVIFGFFFIPGHFSFWFLLKFFGFLVKQPEASVAKAVVFSQPVMAWRKLLNFQRFHLQNVKRCFSKTKLLPAEKATIRAVSFWMNIEQRCLFGVHDSEKQLKKSRLKVQVSFLSSLGQFWNLNISWWQNTTVFQYAVTELSWLTGPGQKVAAAAATSNGYSLHTKLCSHKNALALPYSRRTHCNAIKEYTVIWPIRDWCTRLQIVTSINILIF